MKYLLSLPQNMAGVLKDVDARYSSEDWYADSDPADRKLGSGGGTAWILDRWQKSTGQRSEATKKIIIHAGGQSRRLPSYASVGKLLTPIPVMRWALGQAIDQNLMSMQLPLLEQIMSKSTPGQNTLIVSGDVCITSDSPIPRLPEADVVCFGLWTDPVQASHHGVFLSSRENPDRLDYMLQKPRPQELAALAKTHLYMLDLGLWLLSDRAVEVLRKKSSNPDGTIGFYDLYSQFGCALGLNPSQPDKDVEGLTVAILPLTDGKFYHFGTTRELIGSTLRMQNRVADQRLIMHTPAKPSPSLYVQNCYVGIRLNDTNENIWIENSSVGSRWELTRDNVVTGVPDNDWQLRLQPSQCLDIVPIGDDRYAIRPYGFDDPMRGPVSDPETLYLGQPVTGWAADRGVTFEPGIDIQAAPLFPVVGNMADALAVIRWMLGVADSEKGRRIWTEAERLSADEIMNRANLKRLYAQREEFLRSNIRLLDKNSQRSVYYQLDLEDLAHKYKDLKIKAPATLDQDAPADKRLRNSMLRSRILQLKGGDFEPDSRKAFALLQQNILSTLNKQACNPRRDVHPDQIVWSRSPLRIDLAGGWTDTPPYSVFNGGRVVNVAIELNGQQPLQVFIKPSKELSITLRSIDMGAAETIYTYEQLLEFNLVGQPFSLPKAALALAGFAPGFSAQNYPSLKSQLEDFGGGFELTLLSAVPAGSGLGTSSILGATVLGALSDFCGLAWDTTEICSRTFALEQLLTTGGGWQDQYGGVLQGVKLLTTGKGWAQEPIANWLPDGIFTDPELRPCHLLYYTGLTRTAKGILGENVKNMFLNRRQTLDLLEQMGNHAADMAQAIQRRDFQRYGQLIAKTWQQNQLLDSGTNPAAVQEIISRIDDLTLGLKLPGAGGGGFIYMVAKDPEAAALIRNRLRQSPPNPRARFVEMTLSSSGLQTSRS